MKTGCYEKEIQPYRKMDYKPIIIKTVITTKSDIQYEQNCILYLDTEMFAIFIYFIHWNIVYNELMII